MKSFINNRKTVQVLLALVVYFIIVQYQWGLLAVFAVAIVLGALFGKMFCKWMCPMAVVKNFFMKKMTADQSKAHMYNYYKVGCPISWVQGIQNKVSLFKIKKNEDTCTQCGLCDKACYIPSFDPNKSLFKMTKEKAHEAFNCSKCLACVAACPNGSLTYGFKLPNFKK